MSENSASYANYLWATVKALQEDDYEIPSQIPNLHSFEPFSRS